MFRNSILLFLNIFLLATYILISSKQDTTFFEPEKIVIKNSVTEETANLELEEYIVGVIAAEMPASFDLEALKAQAVAARSYAKYKIKTSNNDYDVVTDVSNQSYITIDEMKDKWQEDFEYYYNKIKQAVYETKGEVLTYNGEIIEAFYYAMSNGFTEDAGVVFNESKDYLVVEESVFDNETLKNFLVTKEFSIDEFKTIFNIQGNIVIGDVTKTNSGRVDKIIINGVTYKGTDVRNKLSLRSTDFSISLNENSISITTKGYGHGVGMSQYGANGMAKNGYTYDEILNYYYKNVKIENI